MTSRGFNQSIIVLGSAFGGAAVLWCWQIFSKGRDDPEKNHQIGHKLVWSSISGSMNAAMIYAGDQLNLYEALSNLCKEPGSFTTSIELAKETVSIDIGIVVFSSLIFLNYFFKKNDALTLRIGI